MRPTPAALFSALALAACETPQQSCVSRASRDLMIVEALIVETRTNISRGFALEYDQEVSTARPHCAFNRYGDDDDHFCDRLEVDEVQRPVAINLEAERAELESLLEQRERLVRQREADVRACVATYPA